MKYFLEFVVSALVDRKEEVDIGQSETPRGVIYFIRVHPSDAGKVIGKNGKTIAAIRTILNSVVTDGKRVQVEVVDDRMPEEP
jgi:predicted RNA-binding protein YlqC (UPF0109 family)